LEKYVFSLKSQNYFRYPSPLPFLIMGKRNSTEGNRRRSAAKPNSESLPSFDEKALSALTAKIEEDFEKAQFRQGTQAEPSTGNRKPGKGSKSSKAHSQKLNTAVPELVRGTKRDANGNAKKAGKGVARSKKDSRLENNTDEKDDRAVLLREILALGGTEEDLDLVGDALSDEEHETAITRPDNKFRQDLAKFVAGLGIEGQVEEYEHEDENTDDETTGKEIDGGGDDGWEEASDSGSSVDASEVEAEPESRSRLLDSVPLATSVSNASNHLVSNVPVRAMAL
jgi:ribosome biogenesis protein MAK21